MKGKFYEHVQQPYENAYLFGTQLRVLSRQSHPELLTFQCENVIKDQFIKGLKDRSFRTTPRTKLQIDKDHKSLNKICYNWNKIGHYKRDCANKPKNALNNINPQPTDMHGIGELNDIDVLFLVDTGAKHSCISNREMKTYGRVTAKFEVNGSEVVFDSLVIHNLYNEVNLGLDTLKRFETPRDALNILKNWTSRSYDNKRMEEFLSKGTFGKQLKNCEKMMLKIPNHSLGQAKIILNSIDSTTS
ncbi:hypothetical protein BpHYR1_013012 [Brachionus plicatilis]|uniref:Retrovirus-related Pol poly from transposon n=1 Tax=Brachionus plicatilis TaxID=10195 RepID=A0A3M7R1C6_BRAPC|nr:hypothetical protein BpHYR1_013012 [Brachionus plicatilis]